jgi:hypothetical protein
MHRISANKKGVNVNSLGSHLINCSAVLWLEGRSCSEAFWSQTACSAGAERTVYDLGGWSL